MTILVIAEHEKGEILPATLAAVTAATEVASHTGGEVHMLVAGDGAADVASKASAVAGVAKVLHASAGQYANALAEDMSALVARTAGDGGYTHIIAAATTTGKDYMPRVAAALDVAQLSEIVSVVSGDTFIRPIYAGNALETVQSADGVKVITARATAFDKAAAEGGSASVEEIGAADSAALSEFVKMEVTESDRPELTSARVVVSGGRGVGSKENFAVIEGLADKLGAAVGASRAAVDAGYVPNDYQVGQTGKVVAPDLYIAAGISGAIQHIAGMKDSKIIVAINKDENAPIFEVADYGLVADLFDAIPEIQSKL